MSFEIVFKSGFLKTCFFIILSPGRACQVKIIECPMGYTGNLVLYSILLQMIKKTMNERQGIKQASCLYVDIFKAIEVKVLAPVQ